MVWKPEVHLNIETDFSNSCLPEWGTEPDEVDFPKSSAGNTGLYWEG